MDADVAIRKVGKTGTPAAADLLSAQQQNARGITHGADGAVYWVAAGTSPNGFVRRAQANDGSGYADFATAQPDPLVVTSDGTSVYWTTGTPGTSTGTVRAKQYGTSGAEAVLAQNQAYPHSIVVDNGALYWANTSAILKRIIGQGTTITIASNISPVQIAAGGGYVYWTNDGTAVRRAPDTGGAAEHLYHPSPVGGLGIAVDATRVYWAQGNSIWTVPLAGGTPARVATGLATPSMVALDGAYVYWCEQSIGGRIMRAWK